MKTADPDIDAGPPNPPRRNCHRKPRRVVPVAPVPPRVEVPAGFAGRRTVTTGLIARFLGVAPRTVSKWVDAGALPGHRLAGSLDRRVRREDLVNFLRANGYGPEADALDPPAGRLLLVACPPAYAAAAAASGAEEVVPQPDPVSAAALVAGGWVPSAVLAHGSAGREALAAIAAVLARLAPDAARVAVLGDDAPAGPPGWAAVPESAGPAAALAALGRGGVPK